MKMFLFYSLLFYECIFLAYTLLTKYETLNYPPLKIKIDDNLNRKINLNFHAYNKTFIIKLKSDTSFFSKNFVLQIDDKIYKNPSRIYDLFFSGQLIDDPFSDVHGSVIDGVFYGMIETQNNTYYLENKYKFDFLMKQKNNSNFHSIIYREIDHVSNVTMKCGNHNTSNNFSANRSIENYIKPALLQETIIKNKKIYPVRTCTMHLMTDASVYDAVYNREGSKDVNKTESYIITLLREYMREVNEVYSTTNFNGIVGINFFVEKFTIYSSKNCIKRGKKREVVDPHKDSIFCQTNMSDTDQLIEFSAIDHSAFCLAYLITYTFNRESYMITNFLDDSADKHRGACAPILFVNNKTYSFNIGILTYKPFHNGILTLKQSAISFIHALAHNLGAKHYDTNKCSYKNIEGYLMSDKIEEIKKREFSDCSISAMSNFLKKLLSNKPVNITIKGNYSYVNRNCFTESKTPFCGNGIKEGLEECDCGFSKEDCNAVGDTCCQYPDNKSKKNMCRFPELMLCDPLNDKCCNPKTCKNFLIIDRKICNKSFDCYHASKCDGSDKCPKNLPVLDYTPCQNNTKICFNEQCVSYSLLTMSKIIYKNTKNNILFIFGVVLIITAIGLGSFYFYKKELDLTKIFKKNNV